MPTWDLMGCSFQFGNILFHLEREALREECKLSTDTWGFSPAVCGFERSRGLAKEKLPLKWMAHIFRSQPFTGWTRLLGQIRGLFHGPEKRNWMLLLTQLLIFWHLQHHKCPFRVFSVIYTALLCSDTCISSCEDDLACGLWNVPLYSPTCQPICLHVVWH